MKKFKGIGTALVTPFKEDGSVDYPSLEALVNHAINGGVDFIVALGTTAETATLTTLEQQKVVETILRVNANRLPVVLGIGGNSTDDVIQKIKDTDFSEIDGILSVSPYYNKPTQEGIIAHFVAIDSVSPVPIIVYNVPSRTGSNMTSKTTLEIASKCQKVISVKEASGDIYQCMEILKNKPKDFGLLSGDDNLNAPLLAMGAEGVISVTAQAFPGDFKKLMQGIEKGIPTDYQAAHYKLYDVTNMVFEEGNPAGIKSLLKTMGIINSAYVRLPLVQASDLLESKISLEFNLIQD